MQILVIAFLVSLFFYICVIYLFCKLVAFVYRLLTNSYKLDKNSSSYISNIGKKYYRDENGYIRFSDSDRLLHRYIASKKIGRKLKRWEVVHHFDGKKCNNNPQNLHVCTQEEHERIHNQNLEIHNSWHQPRKVYE